MAELKEELEQAFRRARAMDVPLGPRLRFIADEVRRISPGFATAVDRFVDRLLQAEAGRSAPQAGEVMPDFLLPDETGRFHRLSELLTEGPVVVAFHRGHWCPYCRLAVSALAGAAPCLAPARVVAISGEAQGYSARLKAEAGATFPLLSDFGLGYALSLNLAVLVDDMMGGMIAGAGWDVPRYQGAETGWILPIPALFLVAPNGVIAHAHVDPDYRRRMAMEEVSAAVQALVARVSRHPTAPAASRDP